MSEPLWDVNDVAEFLHMVPGSIYHKVSRMEIPFIRLSARCLRFDPKAIEAWVAQRSEQPDGFEFPRNELAESTEERGTKKRKAA